MNKDKFVSCFIRFGNDDGSQTVAPVIAPNGALEKKVEKTLSRLTLEEKAGQMMEVVVSNLWLMACWRK